jgi:hypothetical protein
MKLKKVIMFHSPICRLVPTRTYSRGQVITLLPRESILVCIKVTRHRTDFHPQEPYQSSSLSTLCYTVKNTTTNIMKFRNCSLYTLLQANGIHHKMISMTNKNIIYLHKKWLRGYRVWYPLRKMYLMTQHSYKVKSII